MNVIVTMAGEGSRFKNAGIQDEKYKLRVKDRTMFEYSMLSLQEFFDFEFIFITRTQHNSTEFITEKCKKLGIDIFRIVELNELTSGQATTVLSADKYVDNKEPILIYNIDTYVEAGHLTPPAISGDGHVPVFTTDGGSWSYVSVDDSGEVARVKEKEPISNLASLGMYYFDKFLLFKSAFQEFGQTVETQYGERYIAPLYNWLVNNNYTVRIQRVPQSDVHILGTPSDVIKFDPSFITRHNL